MTKVQKRLSLCVAILLAMGITTCKVIRKNNLDSHLKFGEALDSLNGVVVYYNGSVSNVAERNVTKDNYNLGLKYQCVEFVKRYYYEQLHHKMPDSYGNAKDFFDPSIKDGERNKKRDLIQYTNPSLSKPQTGDLLILSGSFFNQYGHVAIVSEVEEDEIEIIQQNPGPNAKSRVHFDYEKIGNTFKTSNGRVLGWLRKK